MTIYVFFCSFRLDSSNRRSCSASSSADHALRFLFFRLACALVFVVSVGLDCGSFLRVVSSFDCRRPSMTTWTSCHKVSIPKLCKAASMWERLTRASVDILVELRCRFLDDVALFDGSFMATTKAAAKLCRKA